MSKSGYTSYTEGEVTLAAAGTVLNVLGVAGNANFGIDLQSFWVDFDGVSATDKPVRCGLYVCTFATNAPGTNSTSVTVKQAYGRLAGTGFSAAKNWTTAPTVIETTAYDEFSLDVNKGMLRYDSPLGQTYDCALGSGFLLRALIESGDTAAGAIRAGFRYERC